MLTVIPKSPLRWDFDVAEGGTIVAHLDMSTWREGGELAVQDKTYRLYRDGMTGPFVLEDDENVFASATKESVLRNTFAVEVVGHEYVLKKKSPFTRTFLLIEDGIEVGYMKAVSVFTRRGQADFPATLPVAVRVFLVWLVIVIWKREQFNG